MSTLSQFISGSGNTLKLKNGSSLFEVHTTVAAIRDFTAQNDHLMIGMTNNTIYIGKRVNELLQCVPNDSNTFFTQSRDHIIGGDPFPTQLNRFTTGIAAYASATSDQVRLSYAASPHKSIYKQATSAFAVTSSSNPINNVRSEHIKRFIYSGDDLFYVVWNSATNRLSIYDFSTGSPVLPSYTYSGSQGLTGTTFPVSNVTRCTYPEIDPATGDIVMYMCISGAGYRLTYDHSANTWQFSDTTFTFTSLSQTQPYHLSISGSNILMASEKSTTTYFYSTDGGDNWTANDVQASNNWRVKGSGVANGSFYMINCADFAGSQYDGHLMRSTDLINWTFIDHSEVPSVNMIRNNGQGTACYIANGGPSNSLNSSNAAKLMAKIT